MWNRTLFFPVTHMLVAACWVILAGPAEAQVRIAYAWGNDPSSAAYAPNATYVKPDDAEVRVSRLGVGRYRVALGSLIAGRGNVQVSSYGQPEVNCQVASWGASGANVNCYGSGGQPTDSRFTVLAVATQSDQDIAYVWANDPRAADYAPSARYAWSPGGPARITRTGTGRYQVALAPGVVGPDATVQVTAYGGTPRHCGVVSWGRGNIGVQCSDPAGRAADAPFSLLAVKKGAAGDQFSFAWANEATRSDYAPSPAYAYAPGASPRVQRSARGRYQVTLNGVMGNIQATAYGGAPGVSCNPLSWSATRVAVACVDAEGRPADSRFTLLSTRRAGGAPGARPDLLVSFQGVPSALRPGEPLGAGARAVARNRGSGIAPGNRTGQTGYMIDVVLSTDGHVPEGFATFDERFREDVLLRAGRASNTPDLAGGGSAALDIENDTIPADTPAGDYQLCARIDPGNVVAESREDNNVACQPVHVAGAPQRSPLFQRGLNSGSGNLRGFVDLHAHPMAHLGFGGKVLHGAPGAGVRMPPGAIYDPRGVGMSGATCNNVARNANSVQEALGTCYSSHAGHDFLKNKCGNHVRRLVLNGFEDGKNTNKPHGIDHPQGYPSFTHWPKHNDILHQQMWVDWIKRAYDGGLRVMVALAVNSYTLAVGVEANEPRNDKTSGDIQIDELRRFVGKHGWMEVAQSPADLRRIVGRNDKLAVVIGVELDDIGDFVKDKARPGPEAVRAGIRRLHGKGVRYIFPVHVIDNYFGGTAVYEDEFNRANCYHFGSWWRLGCATPSEGITHKVNSGWDVFKSMKLGHCGGAWPVPSCSTGHVNTVGLKHLGKIALDEMMRLGMIIDIDHSSRRTVADIFSHTRSVGYPLVSGHNGLRGTSGNENSRTTADYSEIARRGGIAGVGWGESERVPGATADAVEWLGYLKQVKATGVAINLGSDINGLVKMPPPRPACATNPCVTYSATFPQARHGTRTWDYNTEGVAHVGLFPDLLRDVEAQTGGTQIVNQLFHGAETFAAMWEKAVQAGREVPVAAGMKVIAARYGRNCKLPASTGDITRHVAAQCDGNPSCNYSFSWAPWGRDPSPSLCKKQIEIQWRCANGAAKSTLVMHERTPQTVRLSCP